MRSEHNDSQAAVIGGLSARPGETQQDDRQPATQSSPSFCFHGWFYTGPPANDPAQNSDRAVRWIEPSHFLLATARSAREGWRHGTTRSNAGYVSHAAVPERAHRGQNQRHV